MEADTLEQEAVDALALIDSLISAYVGWNELRVHGNTMNMFYSDIFDFANFRVETAETIALLVRTERIADALGLERALLENYLMLRLMAGGNRYFGVRRASGSTVRDKALADARANLVAAHARGESLDCLEVRFHPRKPEYLIWVWDGPRASNDPDMVIPFHYFSFREFRPEILRLVGANYASDVPPEYAPSEDVLATMEKHRAQVKENFNLYLSYDSLLNSLLINGLADEQNVHRIEAHYTFLGKYLHPTHDAGRHLHEHANNHEGTTGSGIRQPYDRHAILLAALYDVWLLASILEELVTLAEGAPKEQYLDPGTQELRLLLEQVEARFHYFWFIWNGAPALDKFNHAALNMTQEQRNRYDNYLEIPGDDIKFDLDVYSHSREQFQVQRRYELGDYWPPFGGHVRAPELPVYDPLKTPNCPDDLIPLTPSNVGHTVVWRCSQCGFVQF